jgi:hypothetical protein
LAHSNEISDPEVEIIFSDFQLRSAKGGVAAVGFERALGADEMGVCTLGGAVLVPVERARCDLRTTSARAVKS